ncbi:EF-hand domain-containing protein [Rhodoplanes roseus]|uniref:EF-hand domain-containing protein n=1 Tax=Rhodoplanes roseus TaxID=29409 RepID=A0A327KWR0_9BRAD|nr:EF-hand domain-containing protein [Rhodoplanes roseus]RAI42454.1 hypothetical protein CH341_19495 [Rhodoplanes roseus]
MMFLAGSATSALDLLNSLKDLAFPGSKSNSGSSAKFGVDDTAGKSTSSSSSSDKSSGSVTADTMRALLALQAKNGGAGELNSQIFSRLDRDGSGRISKTEFDDVIAGLGGNTSDHSRSTSLFDALDGDDDGEVSESEFSAAFKREEGTSMAGIRPDASAQDLFQRLLQQQTQMITNSPTGQAFARYF